MNTSHNNNNNNIIYDDTLHSEILIDTHLQDVGLNPPDFYNNKLNYPIRFLRNLLLPLIKLELPLLKKIQLLHNNYLTFYFLLTSNLGSHTFYVLMLPLPVWFGSINLTRDLVLVLGLGIYFTGLIKDLLCLPRPSSPPLKRLTMSHYTSKEYGCPSSHSANATSVSLILILHIINNNNNTTNLFNYLTYLLLFIYWITILFGRLYCGMHGLVDISIGFLIGIFTVIFRLSLKNYWDFILLTCKNNSSLIINFSNFFLPLILITIYYSLIYFHPKPIEPCPCFEDSVAFISVLLGLDLAYWSFKPNYSLNFSNLNLNQLYQLSPSKIIYDYSNLGLKFTLIRLIVGVSLVVTWKFISKPLFTLLINKLIRIINKDQKSNVNNNNNNLCFAFIPRNDPKIIVKFIVYSGIPCVAVYAKYVFEYFNI